MESTHGAAARRPDPRLERIQREYELERVREALTTLGERLELAGLDGLRQDIKRIQEEVAHEFELIRDDGPAFTAEFITTQAVISDDIEHVTRKYARIIDQYARACRVCGCTDQRACPGGCSWAEADLCSTCDDDELFLNREGQPEFNGAFGSSADYRRGRL